MAEHPAAILGRLCAEGGMNLAAARAVFRAHYAASALARTQGNITAAADLIGCSRSYIHRTIQPEQTETDE